MVVTSFFRSVRNKRIAVLGLLPPSKAGGDGAETGLSICRDLLHDGATLAIHEPRGDGEAIQQLLSTANGAHNGHGEGRCERAPTLLSACDGADALLILSDCQSTRDLDWQALAASMNRQARVFDARRGCNLAQAEACGLETWQIGHGRP